jgi:hypothetical protein
LAQTTHWDPPPLPSCCQEALDAEQRAVSLATHAQAGPSYAHQALNQHHYQHQYHPQEQQYHQHHQHHQHDVPDQPSPCSSTTTSVAARQADFTGSPLAASPMPSGMPRKSLHDSLNLVSDARNSSAGSSPGTPASVGPATPMISPLLVSKYIADAVAVEKRAKDSRLGAASFFPGRGEEVVAEAAPCPPPLSPLTGEHAAVADAGCGGAGGRRAPKTRRRPLSEAKTPRRPSTAQGKAPRKSKSKVARSKPTTTTEPAALAACGNTQPSALTTALEGEAPPPAMPLSPQKQLAGAPFDMPFRTDSPLLDVVGSHEGTFAFDAPLPLERPFADALLPMDSPPQKRRAYQDHCGAGFAMPYGDTAIDYASDDLLAYEQSVTF